MLRRILVAPRWTGRRQLMVTGPIGDCDWGVALVTDVGADREHRFPFVSVIVGVVWALCCVVSTFRVLLSMGAGAGAGGAFIGTIVVMGVPVVFIAIRVAICLNACERQVPVAFWPSDRSSTAANCGPLLLMFYFGIVSLLVGTELDQTFFSGQIGRFLEDFQQ